MTGKLMGEGSEMPRGGTQPRCINCAHFKRVFVDDYMRSMQPDRTNGGTCTLNPLWQSISNGAQHYCGQHKSTMRPQSTGPR